MRINNTFHPDDDDYARTFIANQHSQFSQANTQKSTKKGAKKKSKVYIFMGQ